MRVFADRLLMHRDRFASEAVKKRLDPGYIEAEHDVIRAFLRNGIEPEDVVQECITLTYVSLAHQKRPIRVINLRRNSHDDDGPAHNPWGLPETPG